jgi:hypothetical protein
VRLTITTELLDPDDIRGIIAHEEERAAAGFVVTSGFRDHVEVENLPRVLSFPLRYCEGVRYLVLCTVQVAILASSIFEGDDAVANVTGREGVKGSEFRDFGVTLSGSCETLAIIASDCNTAIDVSNEQQVDFDTESIQ